MKGERARTVVDVMIERIPDIHNEIASEADRPAFEKWIRDFLRPIADDLGEAPAPGESDDRRGLRTDVLRSLSLYGRDPRFVKKYRDIAEQYMKDPESVDSAVARIALRVAALDGDSSLYDRYLQHLKSAKTPQEHSGYLVALGWFQDPALVKRTFDYVVGPETKSADIFGGTYFSLINPATQASAWDLVKTNFPAIQKKLGPADAVVWVPYVAGYFCDEKLRDDSQQFFKAQNIPGLDRPLKNAEDTVNACIDLRSLQQKNLSSYLRK